MVEFSGWEMPVQYAGILDEHAAVRQRAGIFDVSHMGEVEIRGPHALATAQRISVNDVSRLKDGQAQYSAMCLPSGGLIDDIIVYRMSGERFFICVNAGNRDVDFAWMHEHRGAAEVIDRGDEFAQIAVQGPMAHAIVARLTRLALDTVPSFHFVEGEVAGVRCLAAHTGYTGEDGWELYCNPAVAPPLWSALLDEGRADGLQPAGLGARDTLRLEAALALYGHELSREITPLEARLGWITKLDKGEFIGREALLEQKRDGVKRRLVGIELLAPGIARQGYPLILGGETIGEVTSGTKSPTLGKSIALGYVAARHAEVGTRLEVEIRGRRIAAAVVGLPFYKRNS